MDQVPFFARQYQRPNLDEVENQVRELAAQASRANAAELIEVVRRWNQLRSTVDTDLNVAMVRYHQDTAAPAAKAEQDFWNEAAPKLRELDVIHARALLGSDHRDALDEEFGGQFLALKQCMATTFAPEIRDDLATEAKLTTRHIEITAKPEVEFRGKKYNMSGVAKFFTDPDRDTRREAHRARDAFLASYGDELDSLYDQLVGLRHDMGTKLGHQSFTPLGYQLMSRTDYGPDQIASFRDALREHIVPIAAELKAVQRDRLGLDEILFHDELIWDLRGNPVPKDPPATILSEAQRMYHELGDDLGRFMDTLVDKQLIDVELRDGKAPGGFCTHFNDLGLPFVFANFNGTDGDIVVVTHECGHAYQAYASRKQPLIEYIFPTCEAAEIHSMGMEFLTYPWMDRFFGADAERYRRVHLEQVVDLLPYIAAVDEFQHRVYAEPGLSAAQRNQLWLEMESIYQPHRRYAGLFPYLEQGTIWQRQAHIYQLPFYYIDYALAEICALQIHAKAEADRERAVADYLDICRVGGSLSFTDILEVGKLRSPFDPDCLRDVAAHIRKTLFA